MIGTAAAPGFQMQSIPNDFGAAFVAIHGSTLDYVAVQEMLDRIVYRVSLGSADGLFVQDLFGANMEQISDHSDYSPHWSPDGNTIVASNGLGSNSEIVLMDADGSNRTPLTSNDYPDTDPAFSPDGLKLVFSGGSSSLDLITMFLDGSEQTNLTSTGSSHETDPDWTPDNRLLYSNVDIRRMDEDGSGDTALTSPSGAHQDSGPVMSPDGRTLAFTRLSSVSDDVYIAESDGTRQRKFAYGSTDENEPCFSTSGRFLAFVREDSDRDIYVKETAPPYREYLVADTSADEFSPNLGSPTPQTSRVLVGSSQDADDNRGFAPYHNDAQAAILAYDSDRYRNFVKIVLPGDPSTLELTPMAEQGNTLVGVRLTADWVGRLHQDAGPGEDTMWNFKSLRATAAVVHLDAQSGKVASVIVLKDSVYPSGQGGSAVTQSVEGSTTVVRGPFRAVYDASGELVAEGDIGTVEIDGTTTQAY